MALVLLVALVQVGYVIVQGRSRERLAAHDAQALAIGLSLLPPTDARLGTRLLRADVGEELLIGCLAVDAKALRRAAVGVVLVGAQAVELALIHVVGQVELDTEAHQIAHLGTLSGLEGLVNTHLAIGGYIVTQAELALDLGHIVHSLNGGTALAAGSNEALQVDDGVAPSLVATLHGGTHVIIGNGAPEVGAELTVLAQ